MAKHRRREPTARSFLTAAIRSFEFLRRDLGFSLAAAEFSLVKDLGPASSPRLGIGDATRFSLGQTIPHVAYESPDIRVDIYHDPRCEIELTLTRTTQPTQRCDLYMVLRFTGAAADEHFTGVYSSAATSVRRIVADCARVTRKFAAPWLRGEAGPWDELVRFVRINSHLYSETVTKGVRADAVSRWDAWRRRDYASLIELLRALPQPLTEADSDALAYAVEHTRRPA